MLGLRVAFDAPNRVQAKRAGFTVVGVYEVRAISGVINRSGFQSLMAAASVSAFDVLVAEGMDRISRDQGDYHSARKRLDFLGITIHTVNGNVSRIDGSLRALMSEMYIENLAGHVRRGMQVVVREHCAAPRRQLESRICITRAFCARLTRKEISSRKDLAEGEVLESNLLSQNFATFRATTQLYLQKHDPALPR